MITLGKRGDVAAHRQAVAFLRSKEIAHILFAEVAPRFADRPAATPAS
jgi:large subunit ribosomal protein L17